MNWLRTINIILLLLIALFQYQAWYGRGSFTETKALQAEIQELETQLSIMRKQNEVLAANIIDLKYGNEAVEEIARNQLGMIKDGEVFYFIAETP